MSHMTNLIESTIHLNNNELTFMFLTHLRTHIPSKLSFQGKRSSLLTNWVISTERQVLSDKISLEEDEIRKDDDLKEK